MGSYGIGIGRTMAAADPRTAEVGAKGLQQGKVEIVRRKGGARRDVDVAKAADHVIER